jgi:hypothetical protein
MSGFQGSVNSALPIAVEGDFASANPRFMVTPPYEGGFQAGSSGVTIGRFAWVSPDGKTVSNTGTGRPDGFVHREQQGLITSYLSESSFTIPAGFPVSLLTIGEVFAKITVSPAVRGQKAFAKLSDGTMQPGASGASIPGYEETNFKIANSASVGDLAMLTFN